MAYTAMDIYESAAAMLFESAGEDADFKAHAPKLIGSLAGEALHYENAHRAAHGRVELESAPVISSLEDEIDFCDEICRVALPFGLCAYFWQDECDNYKAQDYRGRFIDALNIAAAGCPQDIEDVYGEA